VEYAPSRPLMRSLLSQFQTPTTPRRAVGFFGSGHSPGHPSELITQLTLDWLRFILAPVHSSIGTPSGMTCSCEHILCPLTAHQRTVSGSLSLPARGVFSPFPHGTIRYRSLELFSLGTWSSRLPIGFLVSGGTYAGVPEPPPFRLRGSHPLWRPLPGSFG